IEDPADLTEAQEQALISHFYQYGYQENRDGAPFDTDPNPGDTYTLTENTDEFLGTQGDDVFQGEAADLNKFDNLDGAGGNDTLNLYAAEPPQMVGPQDVGPSATIPSTVTVKSIET